MPFKHNDLLPNPDSLALAASWIRIINEKHPNMPNADSLCFALAELAHEYADWTHPDRNRLERALDAYDIAARNLDAKRLYRQYIRYADPPITQRHQLSIPF